MYENNFELLYSSNVKKVLKIFDEYDNKEKKIQNDDEKKMNSGDGH